MRAVIHSHYGEADRLTVGEGAVPTPGKGQVALSVRAASINAADVFYMRGVPRMVRPGLGLVRPRRSALGMDVAGVVCGVGPGVSRWAVGDAVFGTGIATLAEVALAAEDQLAALPDSVSFEHASTLGVAAVTALRGLAKAKVREGQRVLVAGAAGGVGQFAVQLAKVHGAHVTAVCSGRNVERVRQLGADRVIDYETEDPLVAGPYDIVFDNAGGVRIKDWRRVVPKGGVILPNAGTQGPDGGALMRVAKAQWHRIVAPQRVLTFYASVTPAALEELGDHAAAGRIAPLIDTMFTLEHAPEALARVGTHHARGKVIVTMG
ncbi:NAD(P)-dependent alcohol dehydrogenase [Demequina sp.]|uniref:NAD(P)-dependent alcohol dehydrogenase n=1 Tax=Demequina sp. TaxID=2050685 RepID=UPI003D0F8C29